jgi:hypothetical protein
VTIPEIDSAANWGADGWTDYEPIVDPTTELSATVARELAADVSGMTHTACRAWVKFACVTYTSGDQTITVSDYDSVWKGATNPAPTVIQSAVGTYTITWPATLYDELGGLHTNNIRAPICPTIVGTTAGFAFVYSHTTNVITIHALSTSMTASSLNGDSMIVAWC